MKLAEGGKLERPFVCWICQRNPAIGEVVVDTEKYFDGFPTNLQGRQYVCERCATELAKFYDLASREEIRLARYEEAQAQGILRGLKQRLDELVNDLRQLSVNPQAFTKVGDPDSQQASNQGVGGSIESATATSIWDAEAEASSDEPVEDREGENSPVGA